jgi:hypothetical protein
MFVGTMLVRMVVRLVVMVMVMGMGVVVAVFVPMVVAVRSAIRMHMVVPVFPIFHASLARTASANHAHGCVSCC